MDFAGPYGNTLLLSGSRSERFIKKKIFNGAESKFRAPVTSSKLPKLYILRSAGKIAYVGYTNQSISARLSGGLKADGQGYYYGYQWKNYSKVDLVVFCFEKLRGEDEEYLRENLCVIEHDVNSRIANSSYLPLSVYGIYRTQ